MEASLWNIGMKVDDIDSEISFWEEIGAKLVLREKFTAPDGEEADYAFLDFGGTRIFLTPKTVFEDKLGYKQMPGLTHAVFEVEDLDREYERLTGMGLEVLVDKVEISAGFGSRRLAFFRSPNGMVFEVLQILEGKI